MPVTAAGNRADVGPAEGESTCCQGKGGPWGRLGLRPPSPARQRSGAGGPAARSAPPDRPARGNPPRRPCELASARMANGHVHQGDDAKPRSIRGKIQDGTCAVRGEVRSPNHQRGTMGVFRNLSRALRVPSGWPTATLDRTRTTKARTWRVARESVSGWLDWQHQLGSRMGTSRRWGSRCNWERSQLIRRDMSRRWRSVSHP